MNGSRSKNSFEIDPSAYIPKITTSPQILDEVWSSYRRAKPTQITPRNERENTEAIEKNCRPHSQGPVRPFALGGQTGRAGFEIPDRFHRPVRPVSATGQTASAQNRIPARELEVISRLLVQIITKWSQNLQGGSWDRDEPLHKKNQSKTQRITRISRGKEAKEGFPKTSIRGTRDSRGFSSRLDGREANHGVLKPTKRKL